MNGDSNERGRLKRWRGKQNTTCKMEAEKSMHEAKPMKGGGAVIHK